MFSNEGRHGFDKTLDLSRIQMKLTRIICGIKILRVGGSILASKFFDRDSSHRRSANVDGTLRDKQIFLMLSFPLAAPHPLNLMMTTLLHEAYRSRLRYIAILI